MLWFYSAHQQLCFYDFCVLFWWLLQSRHLPSLFCRILCYQSSTSVIPCHPRFCADWADICCLMKTCGLSKDASMMPMAYLFHSSSFHAFSSLSSFMRLFTLKVRAQPQILRFSMESKCCKGGSIETSKRLPGYLNDISIMQQDFTHSTSQLKLIDCWCETGSGGGTMGVLYLPSIILNSWWSFDSQSNCTWHSQCQINCGWLQKSRWSGLRVDGSCVE